MSPRAVGASRTGGTDVRLVLPALSAWSAAGVGVAFALPWWAPLPVWTLAIAAMLLAFRRRTSPRAGILALLAVMAAGGALVLTATVAGHTSRSAAGALTDGATVAATAEITGPVQAAFRGERVTARLVTLDVEGEARPVAVPVLVFAEISEPLPLVGDRVRVEGGLQRSDRPGAAAWLVFAERIEPTGQDSGSLVSAAGALRAALTSFASSFRGDGAQLMPGLAIGDTSAVDADLEDAMRASSLTHLTAVSGANCAIVVAAVMLAGSALRLPRLVRLIVAVLALVGFVVLVTPQPSVLRAAVMAVVVLAALARGRPGAGVAALSLTVVVLLAIDPWLAVEYGFALSVLATAGLLVLSAPLTRVLARVLPRPLAVLVAVPTAAQIACQPVLVLLDPTLPLSAVPANVLAAPAAPVATMLGLATCLLLPVAPPLAVLPGWLAWCASSWIGAVARVFADFPIRLPWLGGVAGAVLLGAATVLVITGAFTRKRVLASVGAAAVVAVVAALSAAAVGVSLSRPAEWAIAACDVGQGAATVLRGADAVALVDTGDDPKLLRTCLDELGVGELDVLVLTHFDRDHVGAIGEVVGRVDLVVTGPPDDESAEAMLRRLEAGGARLDAAHAGDRYRLGDLAWRVLWPADDDVEPGNDASVTLLADVSGVSALLLGDLGEEAQDALLRESAPPPVDVVGVAHHGSADQSGALYERAAAPVALVSVGAGNGYGHPTPRLLDLLRSSGSAAYRTDRDGTVLVAKGDDGLVVWRSGPR